jgi:glycosyltransferase involved in cell wall biosynthesis
LVLFFKKERILSYAPLRRFPGARFLLKAGMPLPVRKRPADPLISLIVPVYNEADAIGPFIDQIAPAIAGAGVRFETIFVNDGSTDATLDLLLTLADQQADLQVVNLSRNFGKEAAMTAGLDQAQGDAVVLIDVDLQDPPELLTRFVELWRQGYDVVYGLRQSRAGDGRLKTVTAGLFYAVFNWMSATPIPHNVGDFRLIDRRVVQALRQLPERGRFMKGLFAWVGFPSIAVPYVRPPRRFGHSSWNYWRLWNFALDGIVSFSTAPLRIWTYFGAALALGAVAYAGFIFLHTMLLGVSAPGYASLIIVLLFSTAANLLSLGMIGEYVSRLFVETKQRPIYLLEGVYRQPPPTDPDAGSGEQ